MEKTYIFNQRNGSAVITITDYDKQSAWQQLRTIVKDVEMFRLEDVDEYGVAFFKPTELLDEHNEGNIF